MSKKSPWLYHFHVPYKVFEKMKLIYQDDDGNEIQQFKTVKKKSLLNVLSRSPIEGYTKRASFFIQLRFRDIFKLEC